MNPPNLTIQVLDPAGWTTLKKVPRASLSCRRGPKGDELESPQVAQYLEQCGFHGIPGDGSWPQLKVVVQSHEESEGHTWYKLECTVDGLTLRSMNEWYTYKRLVSLREDLHDPIKEELGQTEYSKIFGEARFARHGGVPGTTARLSAWFSALSDLVSNTTLPPKLPALVLSFLETPQIPQMTSSQADIPRQEEDVSSSEQQLSSSSPGCDHCMSFAPLAVNQGGYAKTHLPVAVNEGNLCIGSDTQVRGAAEADAEREHIAQLIKKENEESLSSSLPKEQAEGAFGASSLPSPPQDEMAARVAMVGPRHAAGGAGDVSLPSRPEIDIIAAERAEDNASEELKRAEDNASGANSSSGASSSPSRAQSQMAAEVRLGSQGSAAAGIAYAVEARGEGAIEDDDPWDTPRGQTKQTNSEPDEPSSKSQQRGPSEGQKVDHDSWDSEDEGETKVKKSMKTGEEETKIQYFDGRVWKT